MNERIQELMKQSGAYDYYEVNEGVDGDEQPMIKFAELIVRECAEELRKIEQEADRAYKAKEVKERNTFDGYDFAEMLKERFGVER